VGDADLRKDIAQMQAALTKHRAGEGFLNAASPGVVSAFQPNSYYKTHAAYVEAIGAAMQGEYEAIAGAGFVLQLDCPDLAMARHTGFQDLSESEFLTRAEHQVDVMNHALRNIPADSLRMHVCWGNYEGPHDHDIPLEKNSRGQNPDTRTPDFDVELRGTPRACFTADLSVCGYRRPGTGDCGDRLRIWDVRRHRQDGCENLVQEIECAGRRGAAGIQEIVAMTEREINVIERACERLVVDFAYFSDRREYESLGALFVENGTMTRPSGSVLAGREAIVKSYKATPVERVSRHVCSNIRIVVESADQARGLTYAVVYSINANPRVGEFEDEFLRTADGWRISTRIARFVIGE
jgi:hypothetical protein